MASLISSGKRAENLAAAEAAMAKAKKKTGTTLLRWKPDWEGAAVAYREAVKMYKLSGDTTGTIQALRESAIAHKEIDSIHTAAADLEAAGSLVRDERHDAVGACELFRESAELYRLQGSSHDKAAAMYVKAAEAIGESDIEAGVNLMKQACSIFEEENRGMFHDAVFKKAVIFCVQKEKYGSAQSLLRRQIRIQQQHMNPFEADMYKNCLSIIVLRLHVGDVEKAQEDLSKFEELEKFASSEECLAANELICACEDGDAEKFAATLKKNLFKYLVNPIAVIARKLKMPEGSGQEGVVAGAGAEGAAASSSSSATSSGAAKKKKKQIILDEEEEVDLR